MLAVLAGLSFLANAYLDEISRQGAIALDIRIA